MSHRYHTRSMSIIVLAILALIWLNPNRAVSEAPSVTDPETLELPPIMDSTNWSYPVNDLSLRVLFTPIVAYADPVEVQLELRIDSQRQHSPPIPAVELVDGSHIRLRLIDTESGIEHEFKQPYPSVSRQSVEPVGQTGLPEDRQSWGGAFSFKVDCCPREVDLSRYNRDSSYVWIEPRRTTVHESVPVGNYHARVEIFFPPSETGVWYGLLTSPPFALEVRDISAMTWRRTFLFPRRLRLESGPVVAWDSEDVDTVQVETRPYHYVEYRIGSASGDLNVPGLPVCPVILLNQDLPRSFARSKLSLRPKNRIVFIDGIMLLHLHFELVEFVLAPGHGRSCGVSNRSRKLWERDLSIDIKKAQYDSLTVSESEVFEYHTLIVPKSLRLDSEDNLRFNHEDAVLREVRCPKAFRVATRVNIGSNTVICRTRPPQSPLVKTPEDLAADPVTPISISVIAVASDNDKPLETLSEHAYILLWSGTFERAAMGRRFDIVEEIIQPEPEPWPMRSYYIPRQLAMLSAPDLIAADAGSIELMMLRNPGTVLFAALTSGNECITRLPPDMEGVSTGLTSADMSNDTLTCRLDLYERPAGRSVTGGYETVWSRRYTIPLSKKQANRLRKHIGEQKRPKLPPRPGFYLW